ncbi:MAG: recombinase family protein [Candidatus Omnitrophota bacterium]
MKRCGFVIRVSTDKQARNPEGSLTNQLQRLRAHVEYKNMAEDKKDWVEAATYILKGVSGKDSFKSPEFARLFEDIKIGRVNTICCAALDRISRSVKDFLNFFEVLTQYNVEFVCLKQNYDTTSSQGKLFITIMMALAEFEREQTSERNRDATLARAERGLWNGGHLIGYDLDENRKGYLTVNEQEKALVQFAFKTYIECGSICETVKRLNTHGYRTKEYTSRRGKHTSPKEFAYTSVHRILTNYAYIGNKEINKKWKAKNQESLPEKQRYRLAESLWEPIIDIKTFNHVLLLLKKNYSSKHNAAKAIKHVYLLNAGKLWCGECGEEMEGGSGTSKSHKKYYYYVCKNNTCKFRVPAKEIEDFVIGYIKNLANEKETLKNIIRFTNSKLQTELPQLVTQRKNMHAELENVKRFAQGILDQWTSMATNENAMFLKDKLNELGKRRKAIEDGISNLEIMIEEIQRESVNQDMIELMLSKFADIFNTIPPYQQKELINILLHKAILSPTETRIALYGKQADTRLFDLLETQSVNVISRPGISDWLPREDSNLGQIGYDLTSVT